MTLPGMAQLSAAQQALAEFLEIDPDLLAAAALGGSVIAESRDGTMPNVAQCGL